MLKYLQNTSIRKKLLYSCILITIIPILILEIVFLGQAKTAAYNSELRSAEALADRLVSNYAYELEKAETIVNTLADFTPLETYLNTEFDPPRAASEYYKENIRPLVSVYNNTKSELRVKIYHNKQNMDFSLEAGNSLSEFTNTFFETDPFTKGAAFWISLDCYPFHPVLSYFKCVTDHVTFTSTDYVVSVHLKEQIFHSYIENEPVDSRLILVMDETGKILTSNNASLSGRTLDALNLTEKDIFTDGNDEVWLDGTKYHVIARKTDVLSICVLVTDKTLRQQFNRSAIVIIGTGILLFLTAIALVYFITRRLTAGMVNLTAKMNDMSRSNIRILANTPANPDSRDEVEQLDTAFTNMMRQIDELVEKTKEDEARLKDEVITRQQAELRYLQQQINPHYLFNTLESIRMNLILNNDYENANIVKLFAESFRRYINMKDKYSSLYEEMLFIEKYISIQNYRLANKIEYSLDANDTVLNYKILKLLIQPIVENAVIHGIETRSDKGTIKIVIRKEKTSLIISVIDNGAGMDDSEVAALREHIRNSDSDRSIGLRNVYQRIHLSYGDHADLLIDSAKGIGTTVKLIVPAIMNTEEQGG